jgi:hypothetical protein
MRRNPDFHLRFGDLLLNLAAFSSSPAAAERGRPLLVRGVNVYAALATAIATSGTVAESRTVFETVNRVLPSIPERDRGPLITVQRQLQEKVSP